MIFILSNCSQGKKTTHSVKNQNDDRNASNANISSEAFLSNLLSQHPQYFKGILSRKEHLVQIIYTKIDRNENNSPAFTDYFYQINEQQYFYPASTVKFPIAVLALHRLNELNIPGVDKYTGMITGAALDGQTAVYNDPTSPDGRPTIAHYIKKIFLVSDNDASNRLYEFLGQEYINNTLHQMGYESVQILHRLSVSLNDEQNRSTNPVRFFDTSGMLLYEEPALKSRLKYDQRNEKMGKGFFAGEKLVNEPFDFSMKNRVSLWDLHQMLKSVMFPSSVPEKMRFNLTEDDRNFLWKYMSMYANEAGYPSYPSPDYWPAYSKFLFYGSEKGETSHSIRIFNKIGAAYGFLTDVAYFTDHERNIEFMLSATIHCNSDGIYNDDKYEYDSTGYPFLKNLGRVIYEYEQKRNRKRIPDLSTFHFNYKN